MLIVTMIDMTLRIMCHYDLRSRYLHRMTHLFCIYTNSRNLEIIVSFGKVCS